MPPFFKLSIGLKCRPGMLTHPILNQCPEGWRNYETLWEHERQSNDTICKVMVRALRDCPFRKFILICLVQGMKSRAIIADSSGGCRFKQISIPLLLLRTFELFNRYEIRLW